MRKTETNEDIISHYKRAARALHVTNRSNVKRLKPQDVHFLKSLGFTVLKESDEQ